MFPFEFLSAYLYLAEVVNRAPKRELVVFSSVSTSLLNLKNSAYFQIVDCGEKLICGSLFQEYFSFSAIVEIVTW